MNDKKYELTDECIEINGHKLYRIKALRSFGDVEVGDLGGFIEAKKNLSHFHNAWVSGNAKVFDNAKVADNAIVFDNAKVADNAKVFGDALVSGNAKVAGIAAVSGNALVAGNAKVYDNADYTTVSGFGRIGRTTTFFRDINDNIAVVCGGFSGTLDEFRAKVKDTHGKSKYAKEYLAIADLMEMHFKEES